MSQYKCVFIDWHNTLSTSLFWDQTLARSAAHEHRYARLRASLFDVNQSLIVPWMRGSLSTEAVIEVVADHTVLEVDFVMAEFVSSCQRMTLVSPVIPDLIAALRERGCLVVIATDNMDSFLRWTAPAMNLTDMVDGMLCSAAIGALKTEQDTTRNLFFSAHLPRRSPRLHSSGPCKSVLGLER